MDFPLPPVVLRNLSDRSFDKRKAGAQEVEKVMRRLADTGDTQSVSRVLSLLANDFASSINANNRKGGLIGLASCAIGLGSLAQDQLDVMVPAVLKSFGDAEPRVRYYACESLFNIAKVARGGVLPFFNEIFGGVCRLVADVDSDCKNGAALFDRLLKEIVLESFEERERALASLASSSSSSSGAGATTTSTPPQPFSLFLDLDKFVPLLRAHMPVVNPYVRQLLVGWITALDNIPGVDMLGALPALLDGLFDMLSDGNREVRQAAYAALAGFLDQLDNLSPQEWAERVAFVPLVETLLSQTGRERDKFNRVTAVEWLARFIALGGRASFSLAPLYDRLAATLLRCLSDPEAELVEDVARANADFMMLVRTTPVGAFDASKLLRALTGEVAAKDRLTRSAALRWVAALMVQCPEAVRNAVDSLLPPLLSNLLDTGDGEVLKLDLEVLARLAVTDAAPNPLTGRVLVELVRLMGDHRVLLEQKASFIIRRLCLLLEPRVVYLSLARILEREPNREFASLLVELSNLILLTSLETADFRDALRGCACPGAPRVEGGSGGGGGSASGGNSSGSNSSAVATGDGGASSSSSSSAVVQAQQQLVDLDPSTFPTHPLSVFLALYRTWTANPVAALSLCLLAQAYDLAARIVSRLGELSVTVGLLMQVDKLVQLLESPVFLQTRLHLLQPERKDTPALLRALYGLLMLLPQGTAFVTLRERLHAVTSLHVSVGVGGGGGGGGGWGGGGGSSGSGSAAATARAEVCPFDVDEAFSTFAERQRYAREALSAEIRSRSLLTQGGTGGSSSSSSSSSSSAAAGTTASSGSGGGGARRGGEGGGSAPTAAGGGSRRSSSGRAVAGGGGGGGGGLVGGGGGATTTSSSTLTRLDDMEASPIPSLVAAAKDERDDAEEGSEGGGADD